MGIGESDSKDNIEVFLNRNVGHSFVFVRDHKIVGAVFSGYDGLGFIYHLAVDKDHRNNNIGKRLVACCMDKLRENKINKCHLLVFNNNDVGNKFCLNRGWTLRDDLLIYSKPL